MQLHEILPYINLVFILVLAFVLWRNRTKNKSKDEK